MKTLPHGLHQFLQHSGWGDAQIYPIPGDASFRRYFRILEYERRAMLMYAPPPNEDPGPFLHVAHWLSDNSLRGPEIYASSPDDGWVLMEDFGDSRVREWLDSHPSEEADIYRNAIDTLGQLGTIPAGPFAHYDMPTYLREAALFVEWYCPAVQLDVDEAAYFSAWEQALGPVIERQQKPVTVLRDYHSENIMLLDPQHSQYGEQGLIDFQDALAGHPAYDLVSLLQDARRDVSPEMERMMLDYYLSQNDAGPDFEADYVRLGAQRNAKIVGIFVRLFKRDGKAGYLPMIPRVWDALERDLAHPQMEPVRQWFDANIPPEIRQAGGGVIS
ncbi:MAG: aminoglycoside phosphotransferase family protein [Sphingomonadaceae bacterium]